MSFKQLSIRLAAIAIVGAWSFSEPCLAEKGGRGSDGGGRSASGGGGGGGNTGRSSSSGGGGNSARSVSGGGGSSKRSVSGGNARSGDSRSPRSISRDTGNREGGNRDAFSRDGNNRENAGRETSPREQQSFFRGPDNQDRDNKDRDNRTADRNNREGNRDNNRDNGDWRNQVFGNNNRDRDRDNDRDRNNLVRSDNDRGRDRDRDRNDWSRFNDRVRNDWGRYDRDRLPYRYGWWAGYGGNNWPGFFPYSYARWRDRPYYWWGWTPAGRLTSWLVFGWDRPRYWDYGYGNNIWYDNGYVYYDGDRYLPVNVYYQQCYDLAHSVPQISQQEAENMDWAPLGVFAAARNSQDADAGDTSLQLAVNKDGVISGTYFSTKNNEVHPVMGMVDDNNKRAAFAFADGTQPKTVFETSIFNLTKSEATMMVHRGPNENDTEVWHLVRIEQPQASQQASNINANLQR